jgi:hypothetical protein
MLLGDGIDKALQDARVDGLHAKLADRHLHAWFPARQDVETQNSFVLVHGVRGVAAAAARERLSVPGADEEARRRLANRRHDSAPAAVAESVALVRQPLHGRREVAEAALAPAAECLDPRDEGRRASAARLPSASAAPP